MPSKISEKPSKQPTKLPPSMLTGLKATVDTTSAPRIRIQSSKMENQGSARHKITEAGQDLNDSRDSGRHDAETREIRDSPDHVVHPGSKTRHIFDLPDEILTSIFAFVRGEVVVKRWPWWLSPSARSGIQAIQISRLTCRRFHNTSSQSLMPAVDVDLVQQFPARYDEIFAHPVFGKAVTIINFGSPGEPGALEDKNLLKDMGELATALAAVLKKAGGSVRTLNMNLVAPVDKKRLLSRKLTSDEVDLIRSAMRNIKRLRFYYGPITIPWPHNAVPTAYNRQELENLTTLVTALTDSGNLEDLELETNLWHCDPMSLPPNLGIVKAQASWASLSVLDLVGVSIHCSDLEHCLNRTIPVTGNIRPRQEHRSLFDKSRAPGVRLSRVHLVDKSWARILDILRERHSLAVLHSPSGAECEDMGFDTYNRLFGQYDGCTNVTEMEAERYIRGGDYVNPLRALSSEDIVDS